MIPLAALSAYTEITRVPRRDRKRKRFVQDTGKDDKSKKIRTESGQVVNSNSKKRKKNLYPS